MTDLDLAELKRLEAEATPGPWEFEGPRQNVIIWHGSGDDRVCFMTSNGNPDGNAALITALRNTAPALIAAAEERDKLAENGLEHLVALTAANAWIAELEAALKRAACHCGQYCRFDGRFSEDCRQSEGICRAALASKPGADGETGT